ncbi:MAG: NAD-dependent epimerase/dehydratase family protein [Opitutales bacterium]
MTTKENKRVAITGGSGMTGHWIVKHFVEQGYEVTNLDNRRPEEPLCPTILTDLTDAGQVANALSPYGTGNRTPYDAVIHFAAIPRAYEHPNDEVFRVNTLSTYNVLEACAVHGIQKVVVASSESSYGICFASEFFEPDYLPIDEAHPQRPEDCYGLSKVVNEATAEAFHRRTGMQVVSFRLGNILTPAMHAQIKALYPEPEARLRILWSYIDARDVANACELAIQAEGIGCQPMILAADDTSSNKPSAELIKRFLPGVKDLRYDFKGREALISNERVKTVLGWKQQYFLEA